MSIETRCENPKCGKTLRVKDELAGKRAKCPGCGQVFTIQPISTSKAAPASPAKPAPTKPAAPQPDDPDLWQWMASSLEQSPTKASPAAQPARSAPAPSTPSAPAKAKKKKARPKGGGLFATEFSVLGMQTTLPGLVAKLALLGLVIGGALYAMGIFDASVQVASATRVDSFSAVQLSAMGTKGADIAAGFTLGGTSRLMVTRESGEGEYLLLRLKVAQSILGSGQTANNAWALDVKPEDIVAMSGGQPLPVLLLVRELSGDDRHLDFELPAPVAISDWTENLDKVGPAPKSGIGPEQTETKPNNDGTIFKTYLRIDEIDEAAANGTEVWNHPGHMKGERKFTAKTRLDGKILARDVTAHTKFTGQRGMEIEFQVADRAASASWNAGSEGWISANVLHAKDELLRKYLDLVCLVKRPSSGGLTITVGGQTTTVSEK